MSPKGFSVEPLSAGAGAGDVVGPASATSGHLATFDGTTGKLIQDGGAAIAPSASVAALDGTGAAGSSADYSRGDHKHAVKLDDLAATDDNTDLNASTSAHGLLRKLSNVSTEYLSGTGVFSTPAGGGGGGSGFIGIQRFTTPGGYTYTPTSGTTFVVVEAQGGGGGGSGVSSPTSTNVNIGTGGGGGGWLRKLLAGDFSGATGVVGAGGAGGAAGMNNGAAGADTTFIATTPTTYTAGGGPGGVPTGAVAVPQLVAFGLAGAPGGAATTGDDNQPGDGCGARPGMALSTSKLMGGGGGSSHYAVGAPPVGLAAVNTSAAGNAADGKGGGGGGAVATGTGVAAAGGNGSAGIVIIWEYA